MYETKPWLKFYGIVPESLVYERASLYESLEKTALRYPDLTAYDFLGYRASYAELLADIHTCAGALLQRGLSKGDRVTICLPNCPQAVIMFYALNRIGAVASMIHPLSAPEEIEFYLNVSESVWALTLDAFYKNFKDILRNTKVKVLLLTKLGDYMGNIKASLFYLTQGRKIAKVPLDLRVLWWKRLMATKSSKKQTAAMSPDELAVILYSGGTTGKPKGIMLSSHNFNCLAAMTAQQGSELTGPLQPGDSILSILPVFHGFGLGVCIHTFLAGGGKCILVPKFNAEIVGKLIKRERPQYMAGVPTLYEALLTNEKLRRSDLSTMKGVYAGGDTVPRSIKERFDELLKEGGAKIELREGYGLTECVTVCMVMPEGAYREGSIGVPYPDILAKVVKMGTTEEQAIGAEGEICVSGPTLMLGYLKDPDETGKVLKVHDDGRLWLHTGDLGYMDKDGYFYFRLRLKRMLKVSGVSVYPSQVEDVLNSHPAVSMSCAIGIPDKYQIQKVKAFIVLKDPGMEGPELEKELLDLCREKLIRWAWPREIEFKSELPKTRVGKIAYTELEKDEIAKARNRGELEADIRADIIKNQEEMLPREE